VIGRSPDLQNWVALAVSVMVLLLLGASGCVGVQVRSRDDALLHVALSPSTPAISSGQWPGWRGGTAQGVSNETNLPYQWSTTEGIRWRQPVPGRGNSSPVVWDDRIFLTSVIDGRQEQEFVVLCYDRVSGSLVWQCACGTPRGRTHSKNGYASATVATDGHRVYASFGSGGLMCVDMQGNLQWKVSLGNLSQKWGTATSPILFHDTLIQLCDSEGPSFLVALDKHTGNEFWRIGRTSQGCWSTPVLYKDGRQTASGVQLIVNGTGSADGTPGTVIAYDLQTGAEWWRAKGTTDIPCPTAIVGAGLVVSSSGDNGPIFAIRPGSNGRDAQVLWRHPRGGPDISTGLIHEARLFLVSSHGVATCYDVSTGRRLWRQRLRGQFSASLVAGDGRVYAVSEQGDVYVFSAAESFQLLATNRMKQRCLATPAISHRELFLRTETHLFCAAARQSPQLTTQNTDRPAAAATDPVVATGE